MPQFGASLTDNARSIIYDRNVFIIPATVGVIAKCKSSFGVVLNNIFPMYYKIIDNRFLGW
jgi:hypothetical protein